MVPGWMECCLSPALEERAGPGPMGRPRSLDGRGIYENERNKMDGRDGRVSGANANATFFFSLFLFTRNEKKREEREEREGWAGIKKERKKDGRKEWEKISKDER